MAFDVLCLRPEADFARVGVLPPAPLEVSFAKPDDPALPQRMQAAAALVIPAVGPKLAGALFEGCRLQLVQVTGAGIDRLDEAALRRLGIPVANVPGGSNNAVAEYAVCAATMLLRRFGWAHAEISRGSYVNFRTRMLADNLAGLEDLLVGIIGFGTIGSAVAGAFRRMGCRICFHDPAPREVAAAQAVEARAMSLPDLLAASDVVTLHVPLVAQTRAMIGDRELAMMKPGAILIQASRGDVVDEAALAARLASGHLGGAAVDVYASEPPAADHPLLALTGEGARRLLLTPHIAGVTRQASVLLFRAAWQNVERVVVRGEPPLHRVY
jgi:phosphoglycerate dehydrogenase-like enzyme